MSSLESALKELGVLECSEAASRCVGIPLSDWVKQSLRSASLSAVTKDEPTTKSSAVDFFRKLAEAIPLEG